jgi:membrane-bound metal-dependent hydrolase YbcI (DUF457 family)
MFIGHFAVGFALKRVAPRTSLGVLMAAPQTLDLLWPIFLLLGWEHVRIDPGNTAFTPLAFDSYPYSHSLVMAIVWAALFAALYFSRSGLRAASVWVAVAVVSHWVLDWITHRPDMPIAPWSSVKVGLGLWNSVAGTLAAESVMFAAGVWIYLRTTTARDRMGQINLWVYVAVLAALYVGSAFGPPPPGVRSLAIVALGVWLFPCWAAWIDRHRTVSVPGRSPSVQAVNRP